MDELLKQISQNPDSIDEFTAEQVTEAQDALKGFMAQVKSREIQAGADELAEVKALTEKLSARGSKIAEEQAAFDAQVAELEEALGIVQEPEEDPDEDDDEEPVVVVSPSGDGNDNEQVQEAIDELEPVTAAAKPKLGAVAKRIPKDRTPTDEPAALVASVETGHGGERVTSPERLAELMSERAMAMENRGGEGIVRSSVAKFSTKGELVSTDGSLAEGTELLGKIKQRSNELESLTAALAFCAPAQPIYEQYGNISRDGLISLPTVTATRGQVIFPNSIAYPTLRNEPALGAEWSGTGSKQVYTFDCPETTECAVVANTIIIEFNNATARFYPEAVADLNAKALATAAHAVNTRHIADIEASTKVQDYGADDTGGGGLVNLSSNLAFHLPYYREKYRLAKTAVLDLILPHWVIDALFADAYARDSTTDYRGVRSRVMGLFDDLNVRPQFVYGWQGTYDVGVATWPTEVDLMFWEPGTVVRLDSGTLDLGVVRDSTLNATNDYQTFVETFEAICVPGNEIALLENVDICPDGATGARVTLTPCTPGPS